LHVCEGKIMSSYVTAGLQIIQGLEAQKATKTEGKALRNQGAVALRESEREAARLQETNEDFEQKQRLSFLKSGVKLEGTPLDVLAETQRVGAEEVTAVREAGVARAGLFRSKARVTERGGRASFLGSLASASATIQEDPSGGSIFSTKAS